MNTRFLRSGIFTLVLVVGIAAVMYMFLFDTPKPDTIAYSGGDKSFLGFVSEGAVEKVVQSGNAIEITLKEKDPKTGRYFNTIVLAGPDGQTLLHYRKLNPWPWAETGWATKGDRGLAYVDTPLGRLGLLICYDINYEPPRLKEAGIDTLLYCIAWVDSADTDWFTARLPENARKNNFAIVGANWTAPGKPDWHGYGHSLILDRTGRTLAKVASDLAEEIIYAELPVP